MKPFLLAAAAAAALLATPAAARDNSAYFGIEVGPMFLKDMDLEVDGVDLVDLDHKLGVDGDLILGYDFGIIRTEIEGGYKWAKFDEVEVGDDAIDINGHSRAWSFMGNAMVDLGDNEVVNFYLGAGAGIAMIRQKTEPDEDDDDLDIRDSNFAWQIIAGVRAPVFRHFDVGVKYRYFDGGKINDQFDGDQVSTEWRSHSLLASLIYNFAAVERRLPPPPLPLPPAPPPPPPATKTCPDGSVVLETDPCPIPPPPPPPPPPVPERG